VILNGLLTFIFLVATFLKQFDMKNHLTSEPGDVHNESKQASNFSDSVSSLSSRESSISSLSSRKSSIRGSYHVNSITSGVSLRSSRESSIRGSYHVNSIASGSSFSQGSSFLQGSEGSTFSTASSAINLVRLKERSAKIKQLKPARRSGPSVLLQTFEALHEFEAALASLLHECGQSSAPSTFSELAESSFPNFLPAFSSPQMVDSIYSQLRYTVALSRSLTHPRGQLPSVTECRLGVHYIYKLLSLPQLRRQRFGDTDFELHSSRARRFELYEVSLAAATSYFLSQFFMCVEQTLTAYIHVTQGRFFICTFLANLFSSIYKLTFQVLYRMSFKYNLFFVVGQKQGVAISALDCITENWVTKLESGEPLDLASLHACFSSQTTFGEAMLPKSSATLKDSVPKFLELLGSLSSFRSSSFNFCCKKQCTSSPADAQNSRNAGKHSCIPPFEALEINFKDARTIFSLLGVRSEAPPCKTLNNLEGQLSAMLDANGSATISLVSVIGESDIIPQPCFRFRTNRTKFQSMKGRKQEVDQVLECLLSQENSRVFIWGEHASGKSLLAETVFSGCFPLREFNFHHFFRVRCSSCTGEFVFAVVVVCLVLL
jgi:hypothetical protein